MDNTPESLPNFIIPGDSIAVNASGELFRFIATYPNGSKPFVFGVSTISIDGIEELGP
jgi:hypothetical protein